MPDALSRRPPDYLRVNVECHFMISLTASFMVLSLRMIQPQ